MPKKHHIELKPVDFFYSLTSVPILLFTILLLLTGCTASTYVSSTLEVKNFEYSGISTITVEVEKTPLTIETTKTGPVKLTYSYPKKEPDAFNLYAQQSQTTLTLKEQLDLNGKSNKTGYITLSIPLNIAIDIKNLEADVTISNFYGTSRIVNSKGDIAIIGGKGNFEIESDSGTISIKLNDQFSKSITAHNQNGEIKLITNRNLDTKIVIHKPIPESSEALMNNLRKYDQEWIFDIFQNGARGTISLFAKEDQIVVKSAGRIL